MVKEVEASLVRCVLVVYACKFVLDTIVISFRYLLHAFILSLDFIIVLPVGISYLQNAFYR